jgi:hypothetical protein
VVGLTLGIVLEEGDGEEEESKIQGEEEGEECHGRFQGTEEKNGGEDEPALQWLSAPVLQHAPQSS